MTLFWFNHYGLTATKFSMDIVWTLGKRNCFSTGCCAKFFRHARCLTVILHPEMVICKSKQKKFEGGLKIKLCGKRLYPLKVLNTWV